MLNIEQFRTEIVRPAIDTLGMGGLAAERLVTCTAIAESGLTYLRQHGNGPALGVFQIEPATFWDIYNRYLDGRADLRARLDPLASGQAPLEQLVTNLAFSAAICRLRYWMSPEPLPPADDADAMGAYWKAIYNTPLGAGRAAKFAALYRRHLLA